MLCCKKQEVIDFVKQTTNLSDLYNDANNLRAESKSLGGSKHRKYYKNFWITHSQKLFESPVNLVMPRNTLENFKNSKHFYITKSEIKKL